MGISAEIHHGVAEAQSPGRSCGVGKGSPSALSSVLGRSTRLEGWGKPQHLDLGPWKKCWVGQGKPQYPYPSPRQKHREGQGKPQHPDPGYSPRTEGVLTPCCGPRAMAGRQSFSGVGAAGKMGRDHGRNGDRAVGEGAEQVGALGGATGGRGGLGAGLQAEGVRINGQRSIQLGSIYRVYSRCNKSTAKRSPVESGTPLEREAQAESMGERQLSTHRSEDAARIDARYNGNSVKDDENASPSVSGSPDDSK
ncbi:hypothetical protein UY3_16787 [Chelonia mydas]|uniref:Uncharacterized protein n=1 Tax=Chelonia mydas TaxID=8469 RepID=M7B234_CHEMY|nr:hypothetical protein UY3_16787 [Chelonia mydas]